ncbi:hypothetical protein BDP27DRAFT_1406852 [Rhodocollybia butyracea]|uniref:Ubiquitin-like protease family profile domain-containing protein n=1 Tax=Rhodocollybia butyracea TaxID=206335 RepID=A0A9P5PA32_9AGAR|nr:hypothetical protein BDP27DRAFT_1406852 [Rhodocollybia butyracea]
MSARFVVRGTELMEKVLDLGGNAYSQENKWLCDLGTEVFEGGKVLVTVAHLGKLKPKKGTTEGSYHWVPMVIDGKRRLFLYGDPLAGKKTPVMPEKMQDSLTAWKDRHSFLEYSNEVLPTTQQEDNHSCARLQALNKIITYSQLSSPQADNDDDNVSLASTASELTDIEIGELKSKNNISVTIAPNDTKFTFTVPRCSTSSIPPDPETTGTHKRSHEHISSPGHTESVKKPKCETPNSPDATETPKSSELKTPDPKRHTLDAFLQRITPEEQARQRKLEAERLSEIYENERDKREREKRDCMLKEHEANKNRQQEYRDRKKAAKIADGWKPYENREKKRKLRDIDDSNEGAENLAEASQPRRELKDEIRDNNRDEHTRGRKQMKITSSVERMNYFQPLIWSQIQQATKKAGKPWIPTNIVRIAKQSNPEVFKHLRPQTLRQWIDHNAKKKGIHKWTEKTLENVRRGNRPGGHTTHQGILMSSFSQNEEYHSRIIQHRYVKSHDSGKTAMRSNWTKRPQYQV